MDVAIKGCLGKGDFVQFRQSEGTLLLAEVVAAVSDDRLRCRIYSPMTTSILSMRRYWAEGNNLDFIELCLLVDHSRGDSANQRFFDSFADQVETLWETISGAFASEDEEELEDFIVNEGSETESIESGP